MSTWRYQTVYDDDTFGPGSYLLVCVDLDEDDRLTNWTSPTSTGQATGPRGFTHTALIEDLHHMLRSATEWEPVHVDELEAGMTFTRRDNAAEIDSDRLKEQLDEVADKLLQLQAKCDSLRAELNEN